MIVIVDYGMGNLNSIKKAVEKNNSKVIISNKPCDLENSSKIILPGVGSFYQARKNLFKTIIQDQVLVKKKPILGICLGAQLFTTFGEEGSVNGLNFIDGNTKLFKLEKNIKVPHVGWNQLSIKDKSHPMFKNINEKDYFYFVHSYYMQVEENSVLSDTKYGMKFNSIIGKDNIIGVQFHPEKSYEPGLKIIKNFIDL